MPNFLENIFARLQASPQRVVLREVRCEVRSEVGREDGKSPFVSVTAAELLAMTEQARVWLRKQQVEPGQRCGLIAANSIQWIAADLALMAEGVIVVPLYHRQTAAELVGMLQDCQPRLVLTGDDDTAAALTAAWPQIAPTATCSPSSILPAPPANPKAFVLPSAISIT